MRTLVILCRLLFLVASSGCTMIGDQRKEQVSATENQFTPNSLSIDQNVEVNWKNDGQQVHSVTIHKAGDPLTSTKKNTDITSGTETSYKFEETGTFHVYCKYHSGGSTGQFTSGMVMTITVTA